MAINESLIYAVPQELAGKFSSLVTILEALGGVIILYVIFAIINMFLDKKKNKQIELIRGDVGDIKNLLMSQRGQRGYQEQSRTFTPTRPQVEIPKI